MSPHRNEVTSYAFFDMLVFTLKKQEHVILVRILLFQQSMLGNQLKGIQKQFANVKVL